jgi:cell division protein FtsN
MRPSATPNTRTKTTSGFRMTPFAAGLTLGLVMSAAIALYITQSPLPFVDRVGTGAKTDSAAKSGGGASGAPEVIDPNKSLFSKDAGETESPQEAGIETRAVSPTGLTYLLQVGAFKGAEDAEQMRARMAILGFEARVSETDRDGTTFYRVRLGPYASIEELNKAKGRVSENGIESSVIRVNVRD